MKNYEEIYLQIVRFEDSDIITSSTSDNIGGANDNWSGWSEED